MPDRSNQTIYRVTLEPVHDEASEREFETLDDLCAAHPFWADLALATFGEDCRSDSSTEKVTATNSDGWVTIERLERSDRAALVALRLTIDSDGLSPHEQAFEDFFDFAVEYPELGTIVNAVEETLAHARPGAPARGWRLKVIEDKHNFTIESGACATSLRRR